MDEMHRIDRTMSPHKADSELSRINRGAGAGARAGQRRDGAPDRSRGRVLARCRAAPSTSPTRRSASSTTIASAFVPSDDELAPGPRRRSAGATSSSTARRGTVRFARPGMRIDLGGFAKGHAVDNARGDPAPARHRATRWSAPAATAASSATGAAGPGRSASATRAAPGEVAAMLPLEDVSISTSGDYERYFDADGTRFHHLIDPATGKSPREIQSVTILADDGLTCEALSKIVFVLGVERGMALVETQSGVDAVVVDAAGALHFSSGLLAPPPPSSASTTQ